jgi:hypothetical protein
MEIMTILKGIVFNGTSSQTSKIRTAVVSVNNRVTPFGLPKVVTNFSIVQHYIKINIL